MKIKIDYGFFLFNEFFLDKCLRFTTPHGHEFFFWKLELNYLFLKWSLSDQIALWFFIKIR